MSLTPATIPIERRRAPSIAFFGVLWTKNKRPLNAGQVL